MDYEKKLPVAGFRDAGFLDAGLRLRERENLRFKIEDSRLIRGAYKCRPDTKKPVAITEFNIFLNF
jgi:hypothetical protein